MGTTTETRANGVPTATISVSDSQLSAAASAKGPGPEYGYFASFKVTVEAGPTQSLVVDPSDFYVQGSDGVHYNVTSGNSASAAGSQALVHVSVAPGQTVVGTVTIDESSAHGWVVYAPQGRALDAWWF
jgi:hypothetical protein